MNNSAFQFLAGLTHSLNPQPQPSAKMQGGEIVWRGESADWSRLRPEEAYRLRGLFSMDPTPRAAGFVRDLDKALDAYEAGLS